MTRTAIRSMLVSLLFAGFPAHADFGIGVKAGTVGLGIEGRWAPLPWFDLRIGAHQYDYEDIEAEVGIAYNGTMAFDNHYLTANFRVPSSPLRFSIGGYSNGNELTLVNEDLLLVDVGGVPQPVANIGDITAVTSFDEASPYAGFGLDFEIFNKAGLNLDIGVLWQGEPMIEMSATGLAATVPGYEAILELERRQLEEDLSDYKAWPVIALSIVYNF